MQLTNYDDRYIRITDRDGYGFTGTADYCSAEYCLHEYGREEDGLRIGEYLLFASDIASIEEVREHGTAELQTERLILRRYRPDDTPALYREFGTDAVMYEYSGWNPYATAQMARETVRRYIESYRDVRFYGWVMDSENVLVGTIGAYDFETDHIEVGFSVARSCWGRGIATAALKMVLDYLTENEGIPCVTAWCAADNTGSKRVLEKAGMKLIRTEKNGLEVGDRVFDRLFFEYRMET